MSKFDDNLELYKKSFTDKIGRKNFDEDLLKAIAKSLGPSIYNKDSAKVSCSDKKELATIKSSFLIKKLGLQDSSELDQSIKEVCSAFGSSNRNKYRVVFYYLLVEKYNKQSLFLKIAKTSSTSEKPSSKKSKDDSTKAKTSSQKSQEEMKESKDIIHDHSLYAAGVGFIPIPIVDLVSVSAMQYKMIKKLAARYEHVSFEKEKAKSVIAGLMGGFSSFELGLFARILFKGIPFFGPIVGGTAMSGFAYASTKLIGEIFDEHFASGGNFSVEELTMHKMKNTFRSNINKWKKA